ncbi:TPA: hypothetical protein ACPSKK_000578, partial [Legionella anisa]
MVLEKRYLSQYIFDLNRDLGCHSWCFIKDVQLFFFLLPDSSVRRQGSIHQNSSLLKLNH